MHISTLDLHGQNHQALDRVGDVLALADHVGEVQSGRIFQFHQLVEDKEQPVGFICACIQIIAPILGRVEVKAAKLVSSNQPRIDRFPRP